MMKVAEGFVDGCLAMLDVTLEMDNEVVNKVKVIDSKKVLVNYANLMLL
ncbi:hypothetical protein MMK73_002272 [Providencia rettgeri]